MTDILHPVLYTNYYVDLLIICGLFAIRYDRYTLVKCCKLYLYCVMFLRANTYRSTSS